MIQFLGIKKIFSKFGNKFLMTNFLRICVLPKVLSGDKEKYLQKKFNKEKCRKKPS